MELLMFCAVLAYTLMATGRRAGRAAARGLGLRGHEGMPWLAGVGRFAGRSTAARRPVFRTGRHRSAEPRSWAGRAWRTFRAGWDEDWDEGKRRYEERQAQRRHWQDALDRHGSGMYPGTFVAINHRRERKATCPGCGHGNNLNPSSVDCDCTRPGCYCGALEPGQTVTAEPSAGTYTVTRDGRTTDPIPYNAPPEQHAAAVAPLHELSSNGSTPGGTVTTPAAAVEAANIEQTRQAITGIRDRAARYHDVAGNARAEAQAMRNQADGLLAGLSSNDLDSETLAEVSTLLDIAGQLEEAADRLGAATDQLEGAAATALTGLNTRHGLVEEAVNNTGHVAKLPWYQHR